ncbi:T9SS type A sorting domain-containing protein [Flavobacterium franklandianum]|uniref:T9SS type A sorting domain-containing protein n=1 Tax=Flavobacterium franklandianum TaxID=2594430 RepID=A0A553CLG5_9FLAO|nr:T9SS type A sorting domain-containing protein [Flavobacterium franklandianum]TRX21393.1 T9SS type A sorting domain-containing protein [Flavobacterium franklandianum]
MNKFYLRSIHTVLFSLQPSKATRSLFVVLLVFNLFFASTVFGQTVGDYRSNGNVTFNAATNWQNYNGTAWVTTTIAPKDASYTVSNTINVRSGDTSTVSISVTIAAKLSVEGTFTLNSSANLSIGSIVVNYNGAGNAVVVNAGSALTVNGDFTVTKGDMNVAGTVYIDGNFESTTGNVDVTGGGSMASSGFMKSQGSGTIFGSTGDCGTGPCSGTSLNCPSSISPASQVICQSSQSAPITFTSSGATVVRWQSTTDFLTFTDITNTTTTLPAQTLTQTTRFRAVYTSSGCSGSINSPYATVTVTPATVGGTVSGGTTICSGSTSGLLTLNGNTGNVVRWESSVSPFSSWNPITNTSNTYTSGVLTQTTQFRAVVQRGTCTSATSATTTVTIDNTNTWTGNTTSWFTPSNWSCGSLPTATTDVVIPTNVTRKPIIDDSSKIALANTLTVSSGSSLIVNSSNTIKVTDKVTNNSGTITFEDSASLVQINNASVNSGNITYKRYVSIRNTDYTYWSSPVALYTLGGVSQNKTLSDKYYSYNSTIDNWEQESPATIMTAGLGYIVRGPEPTSIQPVPPPPPGLYEAPFVGVPNNGNKSVSSIIANRSYLLGNPYPSAISADKFLIANAGVLNGTLYFWTHKTQIGVGGSNPGTGTYAYSGDDYAVYNATGGVGAAPSDIDPQTNLPYRGPSPSGSDKPNGFISVGQGFFASTQVSPSGSSIVFDNSMREVGGTTLPDGTKINEQFFKTKNPNTKTASTIEKHRIWLNLSNTQGAFKQTLIGYVSNAINDYDSRFDGESFDGNEFVDFYSINQDKNLVIQGRALPFDENDEVPLGFRSTIDGTFTINIDQVDGSLMNQAVFIEDKLTNTVFDLKSGNYTFNTFAGTFNDRFVLRYTDKTLSIGELDGNDGIIALYSNNYKTLIIRNNVTDATVNAVELFNLLGQNIANWDVKENEQTNIQIPIKNVSSEIYIVKVKTTKGEFSKKIIIK